MSDSSIPLIDLAFCNNCFHQLLKDTVTSAIKKTKEETLFIKDKFNEFLSKYENNMKIDDKNKMKEIIEENFSKKKINFSNISSYILNVLIPYIRDCFKDNENNIYFLKGLTPLMIYNFQKTINYYSQMINNDIKDCQNKIIEDMEEVDELKKQKKLLKLNNKSLKTNNNNLEKKIEELTKEIEKFKMKFIDIGEKM